MIIRSISLFFRKSIFRKILFSTVILVFLALLFIVGLTYNRVFVLSQAEFKGYSLEAVKQIEHNVSSYISQMETLTYTIATNETVQAYLNEPAEGNALEKIREIQKIRFFENNVRYDNTDTTFLVVSGLNKELYTSAGYFSNLNYDFNFNSNPYTEEIGKNTSPVLYLGSHTSETTMNNSTVFSLIRGILSTADNRLLGYVYLDIDYKVFNKIINNVVYSSGNDLQILDGSTVIYSTNPENVLKSTESGLYDAVSGNREGSGFITRNHTQYFFTYTTMNKTHWKIISLHSMAAYNQKALNLIHFIIFISVLFFVIAATLAVLTSFAITKPIKTLTQLMKKVENEDFNVQFASRGVDEVAALGSMFNSMVERIRTLVKSIYKSKLAEKDAVIYALQSQINPHFLYNTLQSMSTLAQLEDPSDISTMCGCLSSMFRYSIEAKRRFVMLYDEVTHINNYFYLLSIQYKDRLKFSVHIDEKLLPVRVPRFILQPLVENAVLHGLSSKSAGGDVKVSAFREEDVLKILVEDNGTGIEEERLKEVLEVINRDITESGDLSPKFLALNNVNKRLVMNYGKEFALRLESKASAGTRVTIRIPVDGYSDKGGKIADVQSIDC